MERLLEEIKIRKFEPDDQKLVIEFFDQMGGETRAFFNRNGGNRKTAMRFFEEAPQNTVYFLAEHQKKMVGYVFLWDMDTAIPWLGIAVSDAFKGMHLGRKLMGFAEGYARQEGKGGILLTTHVANFRAQALYERSGYCQMGRHTSGELLYLLRF